MSVNFYSYMYGLHLLTLSVRNYSRPIKLVIKVAHPKTPKSPCTSGI